MVYDMNRDEILDLFYAEAKNSHKLFNARIITTVDQERFIGILTPKIRKGARDMVAKDSWHKFIADLPHYFFEENQLHAFIISEICDFDFVVSAGERFLPYVDNWATCDQMSPKVFAENPEKLLPYIEKWIKSKHVYTVRFAIVCLMRYFMDDKFDEKYADMVASIKTREYYINMAMAWYFSVGAVKQFNRIVPYFDRLDDWTCGRAIEKAISSYRINSRNKLRLKRLRNKRAKI